MEGMELLCFQMISFHGTARSCYMEAIGKAKEGDFAEAQRLLDEGQKAYHEGHEVHAEVIQKEAAGEKSEISLLLIHSEDQMMSAEVLYLMAVEMIDLYKKIG
ncbi:PTS cellobiose transporter subunit IIA [Clostridia bacterium]|nr:PTS cellobiose transporter subunit IIA [Clostridia bacterium]